MTASLSKLALWWFIITSVVVAIDLSFVLLAPWSLTTDVQPYKTWQTYTIYDKRYGAEDDAFCMVQSILNALEIVLQLWAVVAHLAGSAAQANKIALTVSIMTLYKTVMYFLMEHFEHYKYTAHNSYADWIQMVVVPSSFWIIVPFIIIVQSWNRLTTNIAAKKVDAVRKVK